MVRKWLASSLRNNFVIPYWERGNNVLVFLYFIFVLYSVVSDHSDKESPQCLNPSSPTNDESTSGLSEPQAQAASSYCRKKFLPLVARMLRTIAFDTLLYSFITTLLINVALGDAFSNFQEEGKAISGLKSTLSRIKCCAINPEDDAIEHNKLVRKITRRLYQINGGRMILGMVIREILFFFVFARAMFGFGRLQVWLNWTSQLTFRCSVQEVQGHYADIPLPRQMICTMPSYKTTETLSMSFLCFLAGHTLMRLRGCWFLTSSVLSVINRTLPHDASLMTSFALFLKRYFLLLSGKDTPLKSRMILMHLNHLFRASGCESCPDFSDFVDFVTSENYLHSMHRLRDIHEEDDSASPEDRDFYAYIAEAGNEESGKLALEDFIKTKNWRKLVESLNTSTHHINNRLLRKIDFIETDANGNSLLFYALQRKPGIFDSNTKALGIILKHSGSERNYIIHEGRRLSALNFVESQFLNDPTYPISLKRLQTKLLTRFDDYQDQTTSDD